MYSPEEKAQLRQLEDMGCKTLYETNIKEVDGGFIIAHQVSYVLDDEVKGVTREQFVAAHHYAVADAISSLYGDKCMDIIKSDLTTDGPAPERYATASVREYASQVAAKQQGIPYDEREGEVRVPRTSGDDARTR